jgi:hypothetical protein
MWESLSPERPSVPTKALVENLSFLHSVELLALAEREAQISQLETNLARRSRRRGA